jgi:hypothetical protein
MRAVSFRLLAHAEIEHYLEDRSLELASAGWSAWKSRRITSDITVGLLAYAPVELSKPPSKLGGDSQNQKAYDDFGTVLERANSFWRRELANNHGIKEPNVLSLFLPLGLSPSSLDSTLLADLSSFGKSRGEVAHSSSLRVSVLADPKTEYDKARQLVSDLKKLDTAVAVALDRLDRVSRALP